MTIGNGLPQYHEAFLNDLTAALDIEAGLRDAIQHLDHADLVGDVRGVLNVERGLASALNQLDEQDEHPAILPEDSPITESSVVARDRPESDWSSLRHQSDDETELLGPETTRAFNAVISFLHDLDEGLLPLASVSRRRPEYTDLQELKRRLIQRNISREAAIRRIAMLRREGLKITTSGAWWRTSPIDARKQFGKLLDELRVAVVRLFDSSDEFGHVSSEP